MAKTMTFKCLVAAFMLVIGAQISIAQTPFWSENFNTASWAHSGSNPGAEVWTWTTDLLAGFQDPAIPPFGSATGATGYYYFNSDANGAGNAHDVKLTGPSTPINCTGKTDVHLRFYTQYAFFDENDISVGVSTDGTNFTYTQILPTLPANAIAEGVADLDVDIADNAPQVWIQFRYVGTWQYHWKLDDVELYEFSAPVHDVTFEVNAALLTVDPAGMKLAGTFSSWSDVAMINEGNGVWSATVALEEGSTHEYKFKNGPNGWESGNAACGVNDNNGGFNRVVTVGSEDAVLPAVCFNSCNACVVPCALDPNSIICDDFETYNVGNLSSQSNHWIPWDLNDAANNVISTEVSTEFASNGTKSMKVKQDGAGDDQLLQLGNKTTGRYSLAWKYYIPTGKATYFNIQTDELNPGASSANFATEVYFLPTGVVEQRSPTPTVSGTFPFNTWFPVKMIVDLDNDLAKLYVDGKLLRAWPYTGNFGAIDYYAADATYLAYLDEVEYIQLPTLVYNVDFCEAAVDLNLFFGQALPQTTGIYDNTNATVSPSDPTVDCWGEDPAGEDILNTTMWYTFAGDGNRYHIETVPCDATNYITGPGDTQMLVYAGDDCTDLTEVVCNDDLYATGMPDWRSAVDIETVAGQNYFMLIDGFDGTVFGGTLSVGEFCIEITKVPSVTCAAGAVGGYEATSEVLCWEASLADVINTDPAGFVLPNEGEVYGMAWAISAGPLDPSLYPSDDPNYLGSFQVLPDLYDPGVVNDNSSFMMANGIYYFTPVVIGNAGPGTALFLHTIDHTNACFFVGESVAVAFLPLTDDITATAVAGVGSVNLTPGGGIGALIGDDSFYSYTWSNGATTQDLSGVAAGTYTVTVSDQCSASATASATVTIVGTVDPASIQSFVLSPNPTTGIVTLNLALATIAEVRIEVLNTLGQTLQTINAGKLSTLSQNVELSNMAQGAYFLRVTVDGETAIRRVVVQR